MRYVVRWMNEDGSLRYYYRHANGSGWDDRQRNATRWTCERAREVAAEEGDGAHVVRLVSREEAIAKARAEGRAEGLREAAKHLRAEWVGHEDAAEELEEMAAGGGVE